MVKANSLHLKDANFRPSFCLPFAGKRCPSINASKPPSARAAARNSNARVKLTVAPFAAPTTVGPTNPPRLPIELISASPAAAPVPDRIAVGNDQKLWDAG